MGRRIADRFPGVSRLVRAVRSAAPFGVRFEAAFWDWFRFYEESESWSRQEHLDYQLDRLRLLASKLVRTSRYYASRLEGIEISRIDSLAAVRALPTISRAEFRDNFESILGEGWQARTLRKGRTSGTTGAALQFYHETSDQAREWAAICHQWKRVGYVADRSRRAEFRSLTDPRTLVDVYPRHNMIRCSILHLRPEHVRRYADACRKYQIEFVHGYPSAVYLLAVQVVEAGIPFPQPTGVLLASEMVYEWQLAKIREAFPQAKIYAHYGCAERTVLAGWCEQRQEYHVLPQYSLVEIDEQTSEVIGTNLYNDVNGFLRYRMTDTVLKAEEGTCPGCGRAYSPRLVTLGGRAEDYLYSPERGWIPPAVVTFPLKGLKAIRELQIVQKERDELVVRYLVLGDGAGADGEFSQIAAGLRRLFGDAQKVRFVRTDGFERGPTGKFKWIVCEMAEMPSRDAPPSGPGKG